MTVYDKSGGTVHVESMTLIAFIQSNQSGSLNDFYAYVIQSMIVKFPIDLADSF